MKFAQKLQCNPSHRATQHLYEFLEKNNHPITESGNFLCYKRVRSNFMDIHSGTFDNSVGNTVSMPRNKVNEDPNQTCSAGLHVCACSYLSHFGSPDEPILEVEVDPKDVVAIPIDYSQSKMRVSSYKVLGVVEQERVDALRYNNPSDEEAFDCDECDHVDCDCDINYQEEENI